MICTTTVNEPILFNATIGGKVGGSEHQLLLSLVPITCLCLSILLPWLLLWLPLILVHPLYMTKLLVGSTLNIRLEPTKHLRITFLAMSAWWIFLLPSFPPSLFGFVSSLSSPSFFCNLWSLSLLCLLLQRLPQHAPLVMMLFSALEHTKHWSNLEEILLIGPSSL